MSPIALTNLDRKAALERLGYSEREAEFLCLAGLHGGYFVRRQCAAFLGGPDGGSVTQLIEKALDFGHAEAATYKANTHIYHLASRPFYASLGQEDNRNRRRKELITIKAKLMGLDFVLAHQDKEYLATEEEKRRFFQERFALESCHFPAKRYAGRGEITERYFIEKYPIFYTLSAEPAASPVVSFCFVDPGLATAGAFETFLGRYSRLFTALREFEVIYVAANDALLAKAARAFERIRTTCQGLPNPFCGPEFPEILEYFEARRLFETRQFASFDRAKLIRLRDHQIRYAGPKIEALYERWRAGESITAVTVPEPKNGPKSRATGCFSTYVLEHNYDLFGSIATH